MSWKLWTIKRSEKPGFQRLESREDALHRACDLLQQIHVKVIRIEGPNGERIALAEIEKWCRANRRT
jgi:hypothetical protein